MNKSKKPCQFSEVYRVFLHVDLCLCGKTQKFSTYSLRHNIDPRKQWNLILKRLEIMNPITYYTWETGVISVIKQKFRLGILRFIRCHNVANPVKGSFPKWGS